MAGLPGSGPESLDANERGRRTTGRTTPGTAAAHGGSLRRRVLVWLLPPLAVLLLVNAFFTYRSALDAVNQAYDRTLTASVRSPATPTCAPRSCPRTTAACASSICPMPA